MQRREEEEEWQRDACQAKRGPCLAGMVDTVSGVYWRRNSTKYFASGRIQRAAARYQSLRLDDPRATRLRVATRQRKRIRFPARPSSFEPTTWISADRSMGATWQYPSAVFPPSCAFVRARGRARVTPSQAHMSACTRVRCCFQPIRLLFADVSPDSNSNPIFI